MQLRIDRHVGAHRARRGDQKGQLHVHLGSRDQAQQKQSDQRDHQQAHQRDPVEFVPFDHGEDIGLGQIDADREHGQGRIQGRDGADHTVHHGRQLQAGQEEEQSDDDGDHEGCGDDLLEAQTLLLSRHDGDTVGPLEKVQKRDVGGHIEDCTICKRAYDQRDPKEPGVGKPGGKGRDGVLLINDPGDEDADRQDDRCKKRTQAQTLQRFRRPLYLEPPYDDAGQGQIDEDIADAFASLRRDLLRAEHEIAHAGEDEHDDDLFG